MPLAGGKRVIVFCISLFSNGSGAMIQDPDLIHFTCIAKGTTILAEFNSKDAGLGVVAKKCLAKTPSFHSYFTHTIRSRTYTFLIDKDYVYFAIFDDKLENPEGLAFLRGVREAFESVFKAERKLEKITSHCYQGEFTPVFHQLFGPVLDPMEAFRSPIGERMSQSGMLLQHALVRGRSKSSGGKGFKKIKNRLLGEYKLGRNGEKKENDDDGGNGIGLSSEFPLAIQKNDGGLYLPELVGSGNHKVKSVWKKQVWLVLSLDLFVCVILFVIWLWVCSGFQCMNN